MDVYFGNVKLFELYSNSEGSTWWSAVMSKISQKKRFIVLMFGLKFVLRRKQKVFIGV